MSNWWRNEVEWEMAKSEMSDVLRNLYPADSVKVKSHPMLDQLPPRLVTRSNWTVRARARLGGWLFGLASKVSGAVDDDDEWPCA